MGRWLHVAKWADGSFPFIFWTQCQRRDQIQANLATALPLIHAATLPFGTRLCWSWRKWVRQHTSMTWSEDQIVGQTHLVKFDHIWSHLHYLLLSMETQPLDPEHRSPRQRLLAGRLPWLEQNHGMAVECKIHSWHNTNPEDTRSGW